MAGEQFTWGASDRAPGRQGVKFVCLVRVFVAAHRRIGEHRKDPCVAALGRQAPEVCPMAPRKSDQALRQEAVTNDDRRIIERPNDVAHVGGRDGPDGGGGEVVPTGLRVGEWAVGASGRGGEDLYKGGRDSCDSFTPLLSFFITT